MYAHNHSRNPLKKVATTLRERHEERHRPSSFNFALIIVNLSGRGDKDVAQAADKIGLQIPK